MAADPRAHKTVLTGLLALALLVVAAPAEAARLGTPKQLSPADGASVGTLPPFAWNPVRNADRYEFQIAADAGFNSPVLGRGDDHFFTRNTRATLKKTVPNGRYFWRVRAVTKAGAVSRWSAPARYGRPGRGPRRCRRLRAEPDHLSGEPARA